MRWPEPKFAHVLEAKRGVGVAGPSQHALDAAVDVHISVAGKPLERDPALPAHQPHEAAECNTRPFLVACRLRNDVSVEHRIDGQPTGSDLGVALELRHADAPLLLDLQFHIVFPSRVNGSPIPLSSGIVFFLDSPGPPEIATVTPSRLHLLQQLALDLFQQRLDERNCALAVDRLGIQVDAHIRKLDRVRRVVDQTTEGLHGGAPIVEEIR